MIKSNRPSKIRRAGQRNGRSAFTLIEIMIVVLILATLLNIALPNFLSARNTSQTNACISNLQTIQNAKQEWAIDTNQAGSVTPTWSEISPYVSSASGSQPICPTSLQPYDFGSVDEAATCTVYPVSHAMSAW
jgi:prepilin-type N-terminal cleavage/methylation domain-containing protein